MGWFTEKFIEDCVAEAPEVFLGRPLVLQKQQPSLSNFKPDLLFQELDGRSLIVEVQKAALDRYHLYKCLEYRDLLSRPGHALPFVALVCEVLPTRYQAILATHGVELHLLSREKIVEKASANCPRSLRKHLLASLDKELDPPVVNPGTLRRYGWNAHDGLVDVYSFIRGELSRCGLKENGCERLRSLLFEAKCLVREPGGLGGMLDPTRWNIDQLKSRPNGWMPPVYESISRIRKPVAVTRIFMTSKGNLSMRWAPKDSERWRATVFDWVEAPKEELYAYQRPENEILFIKGMDLMSPTPEKHSYLEDGEHRAALNTMCLALVWTMIEQTYNILESSINIEKSSHFRLLVGEQIGGSEWSPRHDVIGWEIISEDDLQIENAERRIEIFEVKYNIKTNDFLSTYQNLIPKITDKLNESAVLAKHFRSNGIKINAPQVQAMLKDLKISKHTGFSDVIRAARRQD